VDRDLLLVVGCVLAAISLPSIVSALTSSRSPIFAFGLLILGILMIVVAGRDWPGGLDLRDVPRAFERVVARYAG
jgi:hypothetical protein